ncbi:sensor domain-containing protein [Kitasatospora sp. NPDC006697]|uniref:sensor domain-containing protein n=1 Tax=Kitasatospora sp. NPDC006697 TaxID=3364020 RepID=UPI0036BF07D6
MTTTSPSTFTAAPFTVPAARRSPSLARRLAREYGYVLGGLFTGTVGFGWAVSCFALGAGTLVTVLGLPVLALLLAGCRGLGAVERGRIARLLGTELPAPAPVRAAREGFWGRATAGLADAAGWKAFAHELLMFPWRVFSFTLSTTLYSVGLAMAALPAYNWVFHRYVGWPGYRVFDYTSGHVHHAYYLSSFWQVTGASLAGLLVLLLAAAVTRGLANVSRGAARALLSA